MLDCGVDAVVDVDSLGTELIGWPVIGEELGVEAFRPGVGLSACRGSLRLLLAWAPTAEC